MKIFLMAILVLLWGMSSVACLMGYEGDWSAANTLEKILMCILFFVFGPCILISNVIVGLADIICDNWDDDHFKFS